MTRRVGRLRDPRLLRRAPFLLRMPCPMRRGHQGSQDSTRACPVRRQVDLAPGSPLRLRVSVSTDPLIGGIETLSIERTRLHGSGFCLRRNAAREGRPEVARPAGTSRGVGRLWRRLICRAKPGPFPETARQKTSEVVGQGMAVRCPCDVRQEQVDGRSTAFRVACVSDTNRLSVRRCDP